MVIEREEEDRTYEHIRRDTPHLCFGLCEVLLVDLLLQVPDLRLERLLFSTRLWEFTVVLRAALVLRS